MSGIFTSVAGFLLMFDLAIRLLFEIHKKGWKWRHPACQWRMSMIAVLLVPIVASLHSVLTVLQDDVDGSKYYQLDYIQSIWGICTFVIKIGAVIMVDITKPVIQDQLEQTPLTSKYPDRSQLGNDLVMIIGCLMFSSLVWVYAKHHVGW